MLSRQLTLETLADIGGLGVTTFIIYKYIFSSYDMNSVNICNCTRFILYEFRK